MARTPLLVSATTHCQMSFCAGQVFVPDFYEGPSTSSSLLMDSDIKVKSVVIVGAGAAGLEAANVLLSHQAHADGRLNIVLLEARDRIGGRISSSTAWQAPFDLGTAS